MSPNFLVLFSRVHFLFFISTGSGTNWEQNKQIGKSNIETDGRAAKVFQSNGFQDQLGIRDSGLRNRIEIPGKAEEEWPEKWKNRDRGRAEKKVERKTRNDARSRAFHLISDALTKGLSGEKTKLKKSAGSRSGQREKEENVPVR